MKVCVWRGVEEVDMSRKWAGEGGCWEVKVGMRRDGEVKVEGRLEGYGEVEVGLTIENNSCGSCLQICFNFSCVGLDMNYCFHLHS